MSTTNANTTDKIFPDSTDPAPSARNRGWWSFDLPEEIGEWELSDTGYEGGSFDVTEYARWRATAKTPDGSMKRENVVEVVVQGHGEKAPKVAVYRTIFNRDCSADGRKATYTLTSPVSKIPCESWDSAVEVAERLMVAVTPAEMAYNLDGSLASCATFCECRSVTDFVEKAKRFSPENHTF